MTDDRREDDIHARLDAYFDGRLSADDRRDLFEAIRDDAAICEEVASTQRAISMLKQGVDAPDFSARILDEVDRRRGFLSSPIRRLVRASRLGVAACLLIGVLGVAVAQRIAPDAMTLRPEPRYISDVVDSSTASSQASLAGVSQLIEVTTDVRVVEDRNAPDGTRTEARAQVVLVPGRFTFLCSDGDPQVRAFLHREGMTSDKEVCVQVASECLRDTERGTTIRVMQPFGFERPTRVGVLSGATDSERRWTPASAPRVSFDVKRIVPTIAPSDSDF